MFNNVLVELKRNAKGVEIYQYLGFGAVVEAIEVRDLYKIEDVRKEALIEACQEVGMYYIDEKYTLSQILEELYGYDVGSVIEPTWKLEESLESLLDVECLFERVEVKGSSQGDWVTVIVPYTLCKVWNISVEELKEKCKDTIFEDCKMFIFGEF